MTSQFSDVYMLPRWDYLSRASSATVDKNCLYIRNEVFHVKFCCNMSIFPSILKKFYEYIQNPKQRRVPEITPVCSFFTSSVLYDPS